MTSALAVVTGASAGIGLCVSRRLLQRGFAVIGIGRSLDALQKAKSELETGPHEFVPTVLDVTDSSSIYECFNEIGPVDVLVANAGVCEQARLDQPDADDVWKRVMATNVDGVWYLFRALAPTLRDDARAVVVSSGLGKLGRDGYGAYAASKHAVIGLVKCFAKELAPRKITVNAVCPGWVNTRMSAADIVRTAQEVHTSAEEVRAQVIGGIPLKRFVEADEVASLIDWLTSDDAGAVTGQAYNISCGEFFA